MSQRGEYTCEVNLGNRKSCETYLKSQLAKLYPGYKTTVTRDHAWIVEFDWTETVDNNALQA